MPVRKFRTFEEAREALWVDEADNAYIDRVEALWRRAHELAGRRYKPGVYKYRSVEEAQADLENLIERQADSSAD